MTIFNKTYKHFLFPFWRLASFYWNSKNEHGVHSPFVFDLITKCFNNKKKYPEYESIKQHQKLLLKNNDSINKTQISLKSAQFLFRLALYFKPQNSLVLQNSPNLTTFTLKIANTKAKINIANDLEAINLLQKFNLIYFERPLFENFELLLPTILNDSVWIFNNIHCNKVTENTWKTIQNHPKVTVTIDTYKFGIVFFRTEQEKEHFIIRV